MEFIKSGIIKGCFKTGFDYMHFPRKQGSMKVYLFLPLLLHTVLYKSKQRDYDDCI